MTEQYVSPEEMENRRQNMINSCQRVANVLMECATQFQEYAALVPHPNGGATLVDFPTSLASLAASATNGAGAGAIPATKEKKPRKKREKKDPDAPKRPPSAYLLFQNENMQQLREENKDMPYREVLKLVAGKWKSLSEEDRKVYTEAYGHANDNFKGVDAEYKRNKEGALAIAAAAAHPSEPSETSSEAESDDGIDSSDDSSTASPVAAAPPPPVMTPAKAVKPRKNAATPAVATPTVDSSAKKEKKRKNKDIDPALLAPTPLTEEKKKKKKTKE